MSSHNSARIVACPECGAPAGANCQETIGHERKVSHYSRVAAAKAAPAPVTQAMIDALRKLAKRSDAYVPKVTKDALESRKLIERDKHSPFRYPLTAAGREVAGIEET